MNQIIVESLQLYRASMIESANQTNDEDEIQALNAKAEEATMLLGQLCNPGIQFKDNLASTLKEAMEGSLCFDIAFFGDQEGIVNRYSNYLSATNIRVAEDEDDVEYDLEIVWADAEGDLYACYFANDDLENAEKVSPGTWLVRATETPELVEPIYKQVQIRTFSTAPSDLLIKE